ALGLGTFVNFTNCRVSYPYRRVNVTKLLIDPYPLPLREINRIKITAETSKHDPTVTTCPVTPGPMVINIPVVINGADHYVREYFAEILMIENLANQTMCVTFRYLVRDPWYNTDILAA
ncbi:hypothetical protein HID58_029971, partial [Brassica napus]